MVLSPHYENAMISGDEFGSKLLQMSHDAGTPSTIDRT